MTWVEEARDRTGRGGLTGLTRARESERARERESERERERVREREGQKFI